MANVWKVGSRWSEYGAANKSVLSIFRRNNIVFVGGERDVQKFLWEVKKGDYIAIADGLTVVAVARALGEPQLLNKFKVVVKPNELDRFDYEENKDYAAGVKVKIVDLNDDEKFEYNKRGTICKAKQIWDKVIKLYDEQESRFNIESYTYSLLSSGNRKGLLDCGSHYIIPIYQRPYSWDAKEITPFLEDLKNGFLGRDKTGSLPEPVFIGTMQLSDKKFISKEDGYEQDVIDGQQRITTISVLLKELSRLLPENPRLKPLKFDWLETHVNEKNAEYLDGYFAGERSDDVINNKYAANGNLIADFLKENLALGDECDADSQAMNADRFVEYLFSNVFFVVIETHAGLSKTLQIFNAINTTGLDLNSGDLFKIRMYEYMTDHLHYGEEAFKLISALYDYIDRKNEAAKDHIVSIGRVLSHYKYVLIARYNLANELFDVSWETFFERLFEKLLGVKDWGQYKPRTDDREVSISLDELRHLVDVITEWHHSQYISTEAMFAYRLLCESRYGRYERIAVLYLYIHREEADRYEKLYSIFIELNKLFFIYSIGYSKAINEVHSFMNKVQRTIVIGQYADIMPLIADKKEGVRSWTKEAIGKYIAENRTWKNLICKMSEYLHMTDAGMGMADIKELLFNTWFDVEHIHANADETKQWDDDNLQNSIGNLTMLEYDINRSIGNKPFREKRRSTSGSLDYSHSKFVTIRQIAARFEDWNEADAQKRLKEETERIYAYLYR